MEKDYYKILGLTDEDKKLSGDEFKEKIKKNYRQVCLKYHPDRNPGNKEAEEKFKEAAEAYSVLNDDKKRAEYDNPARSGAFNSGFDFNSGFNADIDEILRSFGFGGRSPFDNGGNTRVIRKGGSMRIKLELTLKEMYDGVTKKIRYKRLDKCESCDGKGTTKDSKVEKCPHCGGTGRLYQQNGFMQMMQTCPYCGGSGHITTNPCPACGGRGVHLKESEIDINIPKGAFEGMQLTAQGQGNAPDKMEGQYGDLIVLIVEKEDDKFERDGSNLYTKIRVPVLDALLGCTTEVETISGKKLSVKIPQGSNAGYTVRFKGYGMPIYGKNINGDMFGILELIMPKSLTDDERKALTELRKKENFK